MQNFKLRKGLDLPVTGVPEQRVHPAADVQSVALIGADYLGLKPRVVVAEGDRVAKGAPIFFHKDVPAAQITAPVAGTVKAINRGARRVLISVVIEVDPADDSAVDFSSVGKGDTADGVAEKLCAAGLWPSFRTRPYSKMADPTSRPTAIYVTAMDTEPLSPDASVVIGEADDAFRAGLEAISKLTEGNTYLCHEAGASVPGSDVAGVKSAGFSGPHPAGLPGTHIHFLEPPQGEESVWTIWYQDVIAIGRLTMTGTLESGRVIALAGPLCKNPRLVRTVMGASIEDLVEGEIDTSVPARLISGSILSGRGVSGPDAYLGRYARQVTVIEEDREQIPMGWIRPMAGKFAFQPVLGSAF